MPTKQNHRTASNSKRRTNHGTTILINRQKQKSQKKARKKTEKLVNKTRSHNNNSRRSKSKPQKSSSIKNGKIKPKKNENKIREDSSTYWDALYTKTSNMHQVYYSLMSYYVNLFYQYLYQKPTSLTA